jgi:peptidyl-prolyl cis-trans isomerase C
MRTLAARAYALTFLPYFTMHMSNTRPVRLATPSARLLSLGLVFGLAGAAPWIVQAQTQAPKTPAVLAVTVNGEVQPAQQAELLLREQLARGTADTPALRAQVREAMVNQALMAQAALKAGLERQPEAQARLSLARQNTLAQVWQQQALRGVQLTEADLAAEYERQVTALGTEEVRLRHVLLADEQQARQVHAQLAGGAVFEVLAAEVSRDNSTRERGGLSDWVPVGSLAPGIAPALKGLAPGQLVAQPIVTPSGWQVLRLEAQRPFVAPPLATVQVQLRRTLEQRALQDRLQALRGAARVE